MAKTKNKTNRKFITALKIFGGVLFVAILCFAILAIFKTNKQSTTASDDTEPEKDNQNTAIINTSDDEGDTDDNKTTQGNDAKTKTDQLEKQQQKEVAKNEDGLRIANVVLNEPYKVGTKTVISNTITNIVETEGVCEYTFSNGIKTVTKNTNVLPNAKNTICEAVVLEKGDLDAGKWSVKLKYKSKLSEGVSETQTFTLQ